jgi:hypothetical protein
MSCLPTHIVHQVYSTCSETYIVSPSIVEQSVSPSEVLGKSFADASADVNNQHLNPRLPN